MKILGIDPGTACCGWGIIEKKSYDLSLVSSGCVTTNVGPNLADRLFIIYKEISKVIKKHKPDVMVCEELFFFKNLKTAIAVSHARGVILLAAKTAKIPVFEYTPLQIKQSLTSFGRAEKQQVQKMVKLILHLKNIIKQDDTNDAVAAAICHANSVNHKYPQLS